MTFSSLDSEITGPLFATEEMRAVFSDRARIAAMLRVEEALARAEARFGLAPADLAPAIAALAPEVIDPGKLGEATALAGVPVIPFVKAVQARLPRELEPFFHRGATTQDILDTALVLQMREAFSLVGRELVALLPELQRLALTHRDTPCVGRTYGQHAAPTTFGFKAAVWLNGLADVAARLPPLCARVLAASLGGPVGTLAGLGDKGPAVVAAFAEELGLAAPALAWHASRGRLVEAGTWLAELLGALAKMAADIAHLVSTEVGEAAEPHVPGRGGSSAMPHKRNPVSSTVILAAHVAACAQVTTLLQSMVAAHERPAGLWHAEWGAVPQLFALASGALHAARWLAEGLDVYPDRMRRNLEATRGLLFADTVAAALAPDLGRDAAHRLVEQAADDVRRMELSLRDAVEKRLGDKASEAAPALDAAFDITPSVEAAGRWVDRAVEAAEASLAALKSLGLSER